MLPLTEGFRYIAQTEKEPIYWRQYPGRTLHLIARPWVSEEELLTALESPPAGFDTKSIPEVKEKLNQSWEAVNTFITEGGGVTSFGDILPINILSDDQRQQLDEIGILDGTLGKLGEILGPFKTNLNL